MITLGEILPRGDWEITTSAISQSPILPRVKHLNRPLGPKRSYSFILQLASPPPQKYVGERTQNCTLQSIIWNPWINISQIEEVKYMKNKDPNQNQAGNNLIQWGNEHAVTFQQIWEKNSMKKIK